MINLKNVTVTFGDNNPIHALNNISLVINQGNWVSILGPSGSGKTTLLNVIAGKQKMTNGVCIVDGQSFSSLTENERQVFRRDTMGFIYQHYRLFPQYSVLENVMIPQWPYQNQKELEEKATQLLEKVGMSKRLQHLPEQISGGEKQRVAIARALINNPSILLCDEPTGNLDAENRENILSLIESLNQGGMTIVMVTHDHEVAKKGDYQFYLRDGRVEGQVTI